MNTFLKGTFILAGAAFVSELIEFLVNMVLARELGKEGMGMYMSVLPVIFLIATVANLELPISISKFIAEHDQKEHPHMIKHATRFATFISIIFFLLTFIVITIFPFFEHYHPQLKWVVLLFIPIVAFSAVLRGYFTGKNNMTTIAISSFIRKAVQLTILFVVFQMFHFGHITTSLLVAVCTLIGTEAVILLYFFLTYVTQMNVIRKGYRSTLTPVQVRKELLSVSLPTTGLRLFNAVCNAFQPFLIKKALVISGMTIGVATQHFGMLTGVAMTIGFFPAFFAHSLLVALIPAVSQAHSKKDIGKLQHLLKQSMYLTILYGVPSIVVMYAFAEPLTNLFFHSTEATYYLRSLWPYFIFHFFAIPLQAYLIGLGLVKDALFHTIWSHIVSFSLMFFLGSQTEIGMSGIMIGMNTGVVLLTLLHYVTICRATNVSFFSLRHKPQST
ncbi:polysaccharide biosynthesis protein [Metabacillus iocasae]|uniref:Stage V sporulation protein B n=1 Tax=Priestia iocasae TaxID=2291674 RepID=A0ABS2QY14_9BACI|nr:polysaccharide biosynthesis protein [Metabacillus iocasae]MBM7703827.1 stage V sporulation protein B [Metabacillus iocasae]